MKTFINVARILAATFLLVSFSAFAFLGSCCGANKCETKKCDTGCTTAPACRLKPQPVEIVKTCDHPGFYRQVCRLEYRPCEGKTTRHKACPIYEGCFQEDGTPMDNNNNRNSQMSDDTYTQTADVVVTQPDGVVVHNGVIENGNGKAKIKSTKTRTQRTRRTKKAVVNNNMNNEANDKAMMMEE